MEIVYMVLAILVLGGLILLMAKANESLEELKKSFDAQFYYNSDFSPSQILIISSNRNEGGIAIDDKKQIIRIVNIQPSLWKYDTRTFRYQDLLSVEIYENGESITKTSRSSQLIGGVVGGLALGGVGAIIGGLSGQKISSDTVKMIQLRLIINDKTAPICDFSFIPKAQGNLEIKKGSKEYEDAMNKARHWFALMEIIIKQNESNDENISGDSKVEKFSIADEIKKLANLRDEGLLSDIEYDQQKSKLLV